MGSVPDSRFSSTSSSMIRAPVSASRFPVFWLVGQQQARPVGERPRDRDPLLLAAGELRGVVVLLPGQADAGEESARARRAISA